MRHENVRAASRVMLEQELECALAYLSPLPGDPADNRVRAFANAVSYIRMRVRGDPPESGEMWPWDRWVADPDEWELFLVFESALEADWMHRELINPYTEELWKVAYVSSYDEEPPPEPPEDDWKQPDGLVHHLTHDELYWIARQIWDAARAPPPPGGNRPQDERKNMLLVTVSAALRQGLSISENRADIMSALAAAVVAHTENEDEETRGIILKIIISKLKLEKVDRETDLDAIVLEAKRRRIGLPVLPSNQEGAIKRLPPIQPTPPTRGKRGHKGQMVPDKRKQLLERGILPPSVK